jgi:hypothetical protein
VIQQPWQGGKIRLLLKGRFCGKFQGQLSDLLLVEVGAQEEATLRAWVCDNSASDNVDGDFADSDLIGDKIHSKFTLVRETRITISHSL